MSMSIEQAKDPQPGIPPQRKKYSWIVLASAVFLLIVLITGSLLWLLYGSATDPAHAPQATPVATLSPHPTWAPTEITPPAESLFYDTFANNNHSWSLSGDSGFYRVLVDNMLILSNANRNTTLVESVPAGANLSNYQISVDFTINRGNGGDTVGLYLRGDSTLDHDYRVDISSDGRVALTKEWLDGNRKPQTSTLFAPQFTRDLSLSGQQNTLTVIMVGSSIAVILNNYVQAVVTDTSYASGQIALFAQHGTTSSGVIVSFSKVEIDRITSPLVTPTPTPTATPYVE